MKTILHRAIEYGEELSRLGFDNLIKADDAASIGLDTRFLATLLRDAFVAGAAAEHAFAERAPVNVGGEMTVSIGIKAHADGRLSICRVTCAEDAR